MAGEVLRCLAREVALYNVLWILGIERILSMEFKKDTRFAQMGAGRVFLVVFRGRPVCVAATRGTG
jgi:hypothetical protein